MKFSQILTGITLLYSLAIADNCEEFNKNLKENSDNVNVKKCIENDNGSIQTLVLGNKLRDYEKFQSNILLNSAQNVENLTIESFELTKNNIMDFSSLPNLKELNIVRCIDYDSSKITEDRYTFSRKQEKIEKYRYDLKWKALLASQSGINTLTIGDDIDIPSYIVRQLKENMKDLKKFEINGKSAFEISDCQDIKNYLSRNGDYYGSSVECEEDSQGQITLLKIIRLMSSLYSDFVDNERKFNRLISYPTIQTLVIDSNISMYQLGFKNLDFPDLVFENFSEEYRTPTLNSLLLSFRNLTFKHIEIDNYTLKNIGGISMINKLNFVDCIDYDYNAYEKCKKNNTFEGDGCIEANKYNLQWDVLKSISFIRTLTIGDGIDVPSWVIREYRNNMSNIRLEINGKRPYSKPSDCDDIKNYLERKGIKNEIECKENNQGQVTSLKTAKLNSPYTDEQTIIDRLNSYPTLKSLEFYEETEPSNELTCSKSKELGYPCCSHCRSTVVDKDGLWGAENGQWCVIPDQCQGNEYCWSEDMGYPCCDHCKVHTEDKHGKWGVMNYDWCGIPLNCYFKGYSS